MKFRLLAVVLCLTALGACTSAPAINTKGTVSESAQRLARAFDQHERELQVEGTGRSLGSYRTITTGVGINDLSLSSKRARQS
jgi:hypothetical protein